MLIKSLPSKKGISLVETLTATFILGIVCIGLVSALLYTNKVILRTRELNSNTAKAQYIADILIQELPKNINDTTKLNTETGALYVATEQELVKGKGDRLYTFTAVNNPDKGIIGYKIKSVVFDSDGNPAVITAFAAK